MVDDENIKISRRWQGSLYAASFISNAQGVITLIHKSLHFQVKNVIKDKFGIYLIVQGSLVKETINLINIYGPNTDDKTFFTNLFLTISSIQGIHIIVGDWNCVLDPTKDRITGTDTAHHISRKTILNVMKELYLI